MSSLGAVRVLLAGRSIETRVDIADSESGIEIALLIIAEEVGHSPCRSAGSSKRLPPPSKPQLPGTLPWLLSITTPSYSPWE